MRKPFLSVVIPAHNEEENIGPLYYEIKEVVLDLIKKEKISDFEVIVTNDGSTDRTQEILEEIRKKDEKKLKIIELRRSYGETAGLKGGFDHAKGDLIVMMDGDGQDNPHDIPKLMEELDKGYDAVSGWRYDRRDSISKKIVSKMMNWLRKKLLKDELHDYGCGLKIFKRECVKDLELFGQLHRYITAYLHIKGYKIGEVMVTNRVRKSGGSHYKNLNRGINGLLDLLFLKYWSGYASRPLHFFGKLGLLQWFLAVLIILEQIIVEPLMGRNLNFGPLLAFFSLLIITGLLFIILGFLTEMNARNYFTQEGRNIYTVKKKLL